MMLCEFIWYCKAYALRTPFFIRFLSCFFAGVPVGIFSGSLNQIARTIEDFSCLQNFANKLHWIDLSAENSMVNIVCDLAFLVVFIFLFFKVLILMMSCRDFWMIIMRSLYENYNVL